MPTSAAALLVNRPGFLGGSWSPSIGSAAETIEARTTQTDWAVFLLAATAAACFLGLVGVVGFPGR